MANLASQRAQKWAIFFSLVVPKFTPRKSDRKGVRNAGVWNFHDIWAFGGPDLVKIGHFDRKKNGDFFNFPGILFKLSFSDFSRK